MGTEMYIHMMCKLCVNDVEIYFNNTYNVENHWNILYFVHKNNSYFIMDDFSLLNTNNFI